MARKPSKTKAPVDWREFLRQRIGNPEVSAKVLNALEAHIAGNPQVTYDWKQALKDRGLTANLPPEVLDALKQRGSGGVESKAAGNLFANRGVLSDRSREQQALTDIADAERAIPSGPVPQHQDPYSYPQTPPGGDPYNTPQAPSPTSAPAPGKSSVKSWNLLKKAGSYAKKNSGNIALGALGAISTAGLVGDIGKNLLQEIGGQIANTFGSDYQSPGTRGQQRAVDAQIQSALNERKRQMDMQRLQQAAAQNAQLMMQMQPELYQKVVYGRSVPRGGRIIGGTQLPDALERLAASIPRPGA